MSYKNNKKIQINLWIIPLILSLAVIPLIVKSHEYNPRLQKYLWFSGLNPLYVDLFMYWKSVFIGIFALVMVCLLVYKTLKYKNGAIYKKEFILIALYFLLIVLSAIFSEQKKDSA